MNSFMQSWFTFLSLVHFFISLFSLGVFLWFRRLSPWCWVLAGTQFVNLCLQAEGVLRNITMSLDLPRDFLGFNLPWDNGYLLTGGVSLLSHAVTAIGFAGLLYDLKHKLEFLREASQNPDNPFGEN
ncbi:MAG: hypothetical protein ACKOGA_14910 [Planctomycetaceae bacterium]